MWEDYANSHSPRAPGAWKSSDAQRPPLEGKWSIQYPVSRRRLIGCQWPVDNGDLFFVDEACKKPENGSGHNLPLDTACSWLLGQ